MVENRIYFDILVYKRYKIVCTGMYKYHKVPVTLFHRDFVTLMYTGTY